MSIKIRYNYRSYPYSKKATEYSHIAKLFLVLTIPVAIGSVIEMVDWSGTFGRAFKEALAWLIVSLGYIVLYFAVIRRKIAEIAKKDYLESINKRMNMNK